jgi:hypothetical protein
VSFNEFGNFSLVGVVLDDDAGAVSPNTFLENAGKARRRCALRIPSMRMGSSSGEPIRFGSYMSGENGDEELIVIEPPICTKLLAKIAGNKTEWIRFKGLT